MNNSQKSVTDHRSEILRFRSLLGKGGFGMGFFGITIPKSRVNPIPTQKPPLFIRGGVVKPGQASQTRADVFNLRFSRPFASDFRGPWSQIGPFYSLYLEHFKGFFGENL